MNIKKKLIEEAEKDYKKFTASLIPNINNVLGIRLPKLRTIAKEIYKNQDWKSFLNICNCEFMEETMLQGMVIGLVKDEPENILKLVENFVPKINNWAVCDCFCSGLKFTKKNQESVWKFIQPYLKSNDEFEIRFAYVMMIAHFIDEKYIDYVLEKIDEFKDERYYAKMAVAWALSICYIKFPDKTSKYLKISKLDNWTFNKSIQKICESQRIDKADKENLKLMKKL